jgi:hypothetical protein
LGNIGVSACPMVVFSSFKESHKPPPSGDVRGIVPAHHHGHQNGQQRGVYCIVVLFAIALAAARALQSE